MNPSTSFTRHVFGCLLTAALATIALPASASAQKALVYCPAGIDVTGCDIAVAALKSDFADGVERAYDGSAGTVDLKSADLWAYSVLVVPSLADGSTTAPYTLLRDSVVTRRLRAALVGRVALWSGTPDQGSTNRDLKDALIRSIARWARGNYATVKGPGLVVFQDLSESVSGRYGWVRGLTGLTITPDSAVNSYASVRAVTETATAILSNGSGSLLAYANMASLGFYLPEGAAGVALDAVGQTGTAQGGQVVLLTSPGASSATATVATDRDDYAPGATVTIAGRGFQPGETVGIVLREDPLLHEDRALTSVADTSGRFVNSSFSPELHDVGVRFIIVATGASSGMRAEATFTDATSINNNGVAVSSSTPASLTAGSSASYTVSVTFSGSGSCSVSLSVSSVLPTGVTAAFSPSALTGTSSSTKTSTLTLGSTAATPSGTTPFTVLVRGTGATGSNCTSGNTNVSGTGSLTVSAPTATSVAAAAASATFSASSQTLALSATVSPATTGTVTFTVRDAGSATVGTPVSGPVGAGSSASASYTLPGNTASGTYTITAAYGGAPGFAASSGTASLVVGKASQTTVTVTGVPSAAQPYQATFTVGGSGGNGTGAYTFAGTGACSVNAATGSAQMTSGTGTCSITATRVGDANYNVSSPSSAATVAAALAAQAALSVTGVPTGAQAFGSTFTVGAAGGSGTGAVSFAATGACSVNATTGVVQITSGTGSCSLTASRGGTAITAARRQRPRA